MTKGMLTATALVALASATPAAAATYVAFDSFNGTQGAGNFYYGQRGAQLVGSTFAGFTATTNCFISGSVCLQQAPNNDVPGVTKSTSPSFQYNSVNVPTDRLLLHPSIDAGQNVVVEFRAPTAGTYNFSGLYNIQDVSPSGVLVSFYATPGGLAVTPLGSINGATPSGGYSGQLFLNAGQAIGFSFNNGGFYGNDSTGFQFVVADAPVPEPATWAMMLVGFGMVGYGLRRRASVRTAVRFA